MDKASYVAKNEAVFRTIPIYPGSNLVNAYSIGQPAPNKCVPTENSPPYDRFMTTHFYSLPPGTSRGEVVRFYRMRLGPSWTLRGYSATTPPIDSTFKRGRALLYVAETRGGWILDVDHAAYDR